ncbi:MAG TPA: NAD(P)/FAD-dependent oxidoreductase [Flavipsychrobacter sp.]|nr:NAD(P)/FAD-dependent oxidoreductase [Flavipsychrobacter sp.]
MPAKEKLWDVIIIGAGPAGASAAMVLARSRRNVLIIDEGNQRNLRSHGLHNFITRDGILPPDFLNIAYNQLSNYPVSFIKSRAEKVVKLPATFSITDREGNKYSAKKILLTTGVTDHIPNVPGMEELWGCAVFHCPFCDGYECKERAIGLYAQKHNGYGMAIALRHLSKEITLFTDGSHYLKSAQRTQLAKRNIEVITKKVTRLVHQNNKLLAVELVDGTHVPCTSMFTHHGIIVNHQLHDQLGCRCTKKGAAITNRNQQTNVPGVYVAGDASIDMHFVVVASAEGVKAAVSIHNDLLQEENAEAMEVRE